MELTAPQEASVVTVAKRAELNIPKRTSFPSMFPKDSIHSQSVQPGIACCFSPPTDHHSDQKDRCHSTPDCPSVPLVFHHTPEIVSQSARYQKNRQHLKKVGKRCGVFVRVSRISIGKAASVGPKHLDCHLRCHWPLRNGLSLDLSVLHHRVALLVFDSLSVGILLGNLSGVRFDHLRCFVGLEVLDHPLRHEKHRIDKANR